MCMVQRFGQHWGMVFCRRLQADTLVCGVHTHAQRVMVSEGNTIQVVSLTIIELSQKLSLAY